MAADPDPRNAPLAKRLALLRCLTCGNTVECKPADLLRFTQTGWLKCCGDTMPLFTPSELPGNPGHVQ